MKNFEKTYDKNYKKILIIPALLLVVSLFYLGFFYVQTGDFFYKDVSLTGGTTITLFTETASGEIESILQSQIQDFEIRTLSDNTGKQTQIIITILEEETEKTQEVLENEGFDFNSDDVNIQTTSSTLGSDFYKQLVVAVVLAFFWMAAVVFLIFSKGKKLKTLTVLLNLLLGIFLGLIFTKGSLIFLILTFVLMVYLIYTYIKNSVPSFAVMFAAFADIIMTLALVNILGMQLSTAGVVAFLMLIGYSVDTDILLTTRVLKRKKSINSELFAAFKTGTTMTLTSFIAIATALFIVYSSYTALNQIFTILLIGLGFDLLNTWLTNASIIKWYAEKNQ